MTDHSTINTYFSRINKHLLGRTITRVSYLTQEEADDLGWRHQPIVLELDDGSFIYPMRDSEGNDGGALATGYRDLPIIPELLR